MKTLLAALLVLTFGSPSLALALTPDQEGRSQQLLKNGIELLNQWKYTQAIPVFAELLAINPQDRTAARYLLLAKQQAVEPFCKQAASAYQEGNYKKAVSIWENVLKSNPDDTRITKLVDMANAVMISNAFQALLANAERLLEAKKYYQAIKEFEKVLAQKPDDDHAREQLEAARRAVNAEVIQGHYNKADAYLKQENYDLAIEEWKLILEMDSTQETASRFIAVAGRKKLETAYLNAQRAYEQGNYIESRDLYAAIQKQNPTDLDVEKISDRLNKLLVVVQKSDDAGAAGEIIRKAISHFIAINGNTQAAIVGIRYAEELQPENTRILAIRDVIERENVSEVRSMEPPQKDVSIIEQYLTSALNHIYDGRFDLAIQKCEIVLIFIPQNIMALKRLGSAYYATGKRGKAQEAWGKALGLSPNDTELQQFIRKIR